jgi:DtxR family transcriptional regulator, Mn-dependent transcriptional regulator
MVLSSRRAWSHRTPLDISHPLSHILGKPKLTGTMNRLISTVRNLAARLGRAPRHADRERVEDALKHLHECERSGRPCAVAELAGRLGMDEGAAWEVATRLAEGGLADATPGGLRLTDAGRGYARRVLRTHRLWERYLADRTGVPAGEWHAEAERVEHELSAAEAERLASRLGDPRYDPHGDPIPTVLGEVPEPVGVRLTEVPAGSSVVVTHLEDEPREVFDRLVEAGLTPGLAVEVTGVVVAGGAVAGGAVPGGAAGAGSAAGRGRIGLRVRGEDREIGVVDAENVTVDALPAGERVPGRRRTLAEAAVGEEARVVSISPACQGPQRRRLLDLGVVPGTRIVPELVSVSGDPVAYRIRGAVIALRRQQAEWIEVEGSG